MARTFTRIISNYAVNGGIANAKPSVSIGAAKQRCVRVGAPSEGRITELIVSQDPADATQYAFTVTLFKSKVPFPPDTDQAVGTAAANSDVADIYRIGPVITGVAGGIAEIDSNHPGYNYRNMDGGYTNNQRYVYLQIKPTTTAITTNWLITITVELAIP